MSTLSLVVVGAHLRGEALNHQLTNLGAIYDRALKTAPVYKLYALEGAVPKPGLVRVGPAEGRAFEIEIWRLPSEHFGEFVIQIPSPLCIGTLELEDGSRELGFLCEQIGTNGQEDISHLNGFREYLRAHSALK
jgi:allophanate hydrolase